MSKEYKVGYIFEESELPDVAEFCNSQKNIMTDEYDTIPKKYEEDGEIKEIMVQRYRIINVPSATLKEKTRNKRNLYLEKYVDPIVTNPLRWEELSEAEQESYRNYRRYLLDYTSKDKWWVDDPLDFETWKTQQ